MLFKGKELYIGKIERFFRQGLFVSRYYLYFAEGLRKLKYYNPFLGGVSINGGGYGRQQESASGTIRDGCFGKLQEKVFFPLFYSGSISGWKWMVLHAQTGGSGKDFLPHRR